MQALEMKELTQNEIKNVHGGFFFALLLLRNPHPAPSWRPKF